MAGEALKASQEAVERVEEIARSTKEITDDCPKNSAGTVAPGERSTIKPEETGQSYARSFEQAIERVTKQASGPESLPRSYQASQGCYCLAEEAQRLPNVLPAKHPAMPRMLLRMPAVRQGKQPIPLSRKWKSNRNKGHSGVAAGCNHAG